tara:strand:- start:346 stop:906 length:561 start_codon:yes stop_codon:yes gene_type:complete
MGRSVAAFRGDNELWLGVALISGHLDDLHPAHLAAVFQAISVEIKRPDLWCSFPAPYEAEEALNDLSSIRRELLNIQKSYRLNIPAWCGSELMGLVNSWARGMTWRELISNTSLDEGDVVRVLRRTVDLLSQVPHSELISEQLRRNSKMALKAINRFPVCESEELLRESENQTLMANPATERSIIQ